MDCHAQPITAIWITAERSIGFERVRRERESLLCHYTSSQERKRRYRKIQGDSKVPVPLNGQQMLEVGCDPKVRVHTYDLSAARDCMTLTTTLLQPVVPHYNQFTMRNIFVFTEIF
jgi:hypothetical protein